MTEDASTEQGWRGEKIGAMSTEEVNEFLQGPMAGAPCLPQARRLALRRAMLVLLGRRRVLGRSQGRVGVGALHGA